MKYIKDFIYNYIDIILSALLTVGIAFVILHNVDYLINVEKLPNNSIIETQTEIIEKPLTIKVNIPTGVNVSQLGDLLVSYKIIPDKKDFVESFDSQDVLIKSGEFDLQQNMDFDAIKEILIEKENN